MTKRDRKRREILDKLIYSNCCPTRFKKKFEPYERFIDQALTALRELDRVDREELIGIVRDTLHPICSYHEYGDFETIADAIIKYLEER